MISLVLLTRMPRRGERKRKKAKAIIAGSLDIFMNVGKDWEREEDADVVVTSGEKKESSNFTQSCI